MYSEKWKQILNKTYMMHIRTIYLYSPETKKQISTIVIAHNRFTEVGHLRLPQPRYLVHATNSHSVHNKDTMHNNSPIYYLGHPTDHYRLDNEGSFTHTYNNSLNRFTWAGQSRQFHPCIHQIPLNCTSRLPYPCISQCIQQIHIL